MMMKRMLRHEMARLSPAQATGGVRILLYHAVDAPDSADALGLRVSREAFLNQMHLLRTEGYRVVSLASVLESNTGDGSPRIAITFDDGYRSQEWAVEILRE